MVQWLQEVWETEWRSVSRFATIGWLLFFVLFLIYAGVNHGQFLFIDNVNLVIHEGGHLLFGWLGSTLTVWGGTLLQWLAPLLLALYFFTQRQTAGFAFCSFFFFENWLYTATYMADARAQVLPLVGVGDMESEETMHDWYRIFSQLGVLNHDTQIATLVRILGWFGMLGIVLWFGWRGLMSESSSPDCRG